MNDNKCVCCGEIIPESGQVCKACEKKYGINWGDSILDKLHEYIRSLETENQELERLLKSAVKYIKVSDHGVIMWHDISKAKKLLEGAGND